MKKVKVSWIKVSLLLVLGFVFASSHHVLAEEQEVKPSVAIEQVNREDILYKNRTALELAELVRTKKVTSQELVKEALEQIKKENPSLNAVITLREEAALKEAEALEDTGQPFLGVPILIKGLGQTLKGESNTNGFVFAKDQKSGGTSRLIQTLQKAGFIVIGQTNFPQLGLTNITDSDLYGPAGSPWNPAYQAGGSSGGAGSSVASGMVPVASSSDAGGSIRIPASWNGTIGLKPSRGAIIGGSASNTNQVVHFANTKSMLDTESLLMVLKDPKMVFKEIPLTKVKIAYTTKSPVGTPVSDDAIKAVTDAVSFLREQGFTVEEIDNPVDGVALMKSYYTIGAGSAGIANFLVSQSLKRPIEIDDVDLLTWALYQTSKVTTKEEITASWEFNHRAAERMTLFHEEYPIYLTPTTAYTAPKIGDKLVSEVYQEKMKHIETLSPEDRKQLIEDQWLESLTYTPFTQQANLTGEPAISLPTYVSEDGLPLGIQLNAGLGNDLLLIEMGKLFEGHNKFKQFLTVTSESESGDSTTTSEEVSSESSTTTSEEVSSESSTTTSEEVSSELGTTTSEEVSSESSITSSEEVSSELSTTTSEEVSSELGTTTSDVSTQSTTKKFVVNTSPTKGYLPQLNNKTILFLIGSGIGTLSFVYVITRKRH